MSPHRLLALTLCLAVLLSACSGTRVHLYTRGMAQQDVETLQASMEEQGFHTHLVGLPIPETITVPTIVYSPLVRDMADIRRLEAVLHDAGYPVKLTVESSGNHFYTRNNVGVYPKSFTAVQLADAEPSAGGGQGEPGNGGSALAGREFSADCANVNFEGYLLLQADGRFSLDFILWNDANENVDSTSTVGRWTVNDQMLQLQSGGNAVPFVVTTEVRQVPRRRLSGTTMVSLEEIRLYNVLKGSGAFHGCDFAYTGSLPGAGEEGK